MMWCEGATGKFWDPGFASVSTSVKRGPDQPSLRKDPGEFEERRPCRLLEYLRPHELSNEGPVWALGVGGWEGGPSTGLVSTMNSLFN